MGTRVKLSRIILKDWIICITRNNNLSLKLPKVRTEFGRKGFYFLGANAFNNLPLSVRLFENRSKFKNALKGYL